MIDSLPHLSGLIFAGIGIGMAFAPEIRRRIFVRDKGVCQCGNCLGNYLFGQPLSFELGFNMNAAHYPDMHQPREDFDMNHGRLLSALEHCLEEIARGNHRGASLLYEKQTFMNTHWIQAHGWRDLKPSMQMMYDCVDGDDLTPLIEFYKEGLEIE